MSQRVQGKNKIQRIDMLHFQHITWLTVMRWSATGCAALLTGLYVLWVIGLSNPTGKPAAGRAVHLSTGAISNVHASFENDCQKCHAGVMGLGLSPESFQFDESARLELQANKCGQCHDQAANYQMLGHFRDKLKQPELDRDCARCHQEHQGRELDLSQISNATCVHCHANLTAACKSDAKTGLRNTIHGFTPESHGQSFRSLSQDTGRIKFNHAEHMLPGQVQAGHKGAFEATWLPKGKESRYGTIDLGGRRIVQLECTDCHAPFKLTDSPPTISTSHEEGRTYQPVSFEKHCADCHRLSFAGQTSEDLSLPHYTTRENFRKLLKFNLRGKAGQDEVVDKALEAVYERCLQCHLKEDVVQHEPVTPKENGSALDLALAGQSQSMIPSRWLQYGLFNHAAHTNIKCDYCHPGTRTRDEVTTQAINKLRVENPGSQSNAVDQHIVKINGISSCVPCHRPSQLPDDDVLRDPNQREVLLGKAKQPIRASDDCTLCHRYHWTRPNTHNSSDSLSSTGLSTAQVSP